MFLGEVICSSFCLLFKCDWFAVFVVSGVHLWGVSFFELFDSEPAVAEVQVVTDFVCCVVVPVASCCFVDLFS